MLLPITWAGVLEEYRAEIEDGIKDALGGREGTWQVTVSRDEGKSSNLLTIHRDSVEVHRVLVPDNGPEAEPMDHGSSVRAKVQEYIEAALHLAEGPRAR